MEHEAGREREGDDIAKLKSNCFSLTSFSSLLKIGMSIMVSGFSPNSVVGWHGNPDSSSSSAVMSRNSTGTRNSIPGDRFLWNGNGNMSVLKFQCTCMYTN